MTSFGQFVAEQVIGNGATARVHVAHHHQIDDIRVAIKVISSSSLNTEARRARFKREISVHQSMKHPFIAELFQVFEDDFNHYLVLEFLDRGTLLNLLNTHGRFNEYRARRYFTQLVWVLEYLHSKLSVAHRDLKCENILLDRNDNIRLIDFGISRTFEQHDEKLSTLCGSPAYAAPEMLQRQGYTYMADIWSLGVVLYVLVVGKLPFQDSSIPGLLQKILTTEIQYPTFLQPSLLDLLQGLLCKDPNSRIDIPRIKMHPWFSMDEYNTMIKLAELAQIHMFGGDEVKVVVQPNLVREMVEMGIDCHGLSQSLLIGEETNLTVLYSILRRETLTDLMGPRSFLLKLLSPPEQKTPERNNEILNADGMPTVHSCMVQNLIRRSNVLGLMGQRIPITMRTTSTQPIPVKETFVDVL
jgi:serine/threonine protein kinase